MLDLTGPFREVLSKHRIKYAEKGGRLELCCPFMTTAPLHLVFTSPQGSSIVLPVT